MLILAPLSIDGPGSTGKLGMVPLAQPSSEVARLDTPHTRGLHHCPCLGEGTLRIDAAAPVFDDSGVEPERARIEGSPRNTEVRGEAANVDGLDAARLEIPIEPGARLLVGFDKRRIAIHVGTETFTDHELRMGDGQPLYELRALRAL